MCFSAAASFTASAVLITAGAIIVRKAPLPSQKFFAAIPLIFAIQQFTEGIVWLGHTNDTFAQYQSTATYVYLFFAQLFWPVWVPLSLIKFEQEKRTKKILIPFLLTGIGIALYSAWLLVNFDIASEIRGYHMYYNIYHPFQIRATSGLIYLVPTVISTLTSKNKGIWLFGLLNFLAYLASKLYFNEHVLSVWCFFAALISVVLYFVLADRERI